MTVHIEVPAESLSREAIDGLVADFVTREGTDYGEREYTLAEKCEHVHRQLKRGEVAIIYDFASESTTLVTRRELVDL